MQCPGQDMRYWKPGAIFYAPCPKCGWPVEFFKDESTRKCKNCGNKMVNPRMDFGCAAYCQYAEQCLGELPPELLAQRRELLKDRVAVEMKRYFRQDFKRIGHAGKVARYAEQIAKEEKGDMVVVLCAAYLHDIGIHEAERKHGSTEAKYQEEEGPPIAREILAKLSASSEIIDEVCDIISHHHHPRAEETINFKIVYDADLIVNLEEKQTESRIDEKKLAANMEKLFFTESGRKLAGGVLGRGKGSGT
ncbi:MAG: HD domain-containing protein [Syntrophales bacterium]|nr:HD domain-containing protein [Syntrophales bacterium]